MLIKDLKQRLLEAIEDNIVTGTYPTNRDQILGKEEAVEEILKIIEPILTDAHYCLTSVSSALKEIKEEYEKKYQETMLEINRYLQNAKNR